jgi:hypothetical protein
MRRDQQHRCVKSNYEGKHGWAHSSCVSDRRPGVQLWDYFADDKAVSLGMLPLQFSTYAELDIIWTEHHICADLAQSGYIRTAIS